MGNRDVRTASLTVEEYLRHEETAETRHEYVAGEIYAMTGGTIRHHRITCNIASRLRAAVAGGSSEEFINDMKLRASPSAFYYPDIVVTCSAQDDGAVAVSDPCPSSRTSSRMARVSRCRATISRRAPA